MKYYNSDTDNYAITKQRAGGFAKIYETFETLADAKDELNNIWNILTETICEQDLDGWAELGDEHIEFDVYTYRIEQI